MCCHSKLCFFTKQVLHELDKIVGSASASLPSSGATALSFVTKYLASLIFYILTALFAPWILKRSVQFERRHLKSEEQVWSDWLSVLFVCWFDVCTHPVCVS